MPTKKAETKTASKVIDITAPSGSASSGSGRPLIVTNRPILKDPMVVSNAAPTDKAAPELEAAKTTGGQTVSVQGAPILAPSQSMKTITPPSATKVQVKTATVHDSIPEADDDKTAVAAKPDETDKAEDEPAEAPKTEAPSSDAKPAETVDKDTNISSSVPETAEEDVQSKQITPTAADQAAAAREAAIAEKVKSLTEEKVYQLPINAVERRRSQRDVMLGALLILVLAFAWLDLAAEVGFVKVPVLPVTHFFSKK